jgi:hypothetical protein
LPAHSSPPVRLPGAAPAAPAPEVELALAAAKAQAPASRAAATSRSVRPYSLEPVELVDSKGVPGQSCQWIPKCSGGVSSVVSSRSAHLFLYRE